MPIVTFARAVRKGAHAIITAYGESGCGKTYSLIRLGRGLVGPNGKLGMIDTETGRGLIYANVGGGYEYAELTPPFTPERYVEAIDAAEEAGIDALILDSGSHEWEGLGGVLEIADNNNLKGLVKWAGPKSRHKRYVQRLLNSRMHLLIALRAKEKMVQLTDKMPIPRGMKIGDIISAGYVPIQDKRFIFETTVQLFLPTSNDRRRLGVPVVEKCPEDLWGAFPDGEQISEDTGRRIAEWIGGGAPVDHGFERMKRDAEDVAGRGTEALREHWRSLDKPARQRLSSQTENLASIASAADHEQGLRRRESDEAAERAAPDLDDPFGGQRIELQTSSRPVAPPPRPDAGRSGDDAGRLAGSDAPAEGAASRPGDDEDAFGLKPLDNEPNSPAAQPVHERDTDGLGGPAPAGDADLELGQSLGAVADDRLTAGDPALGNRGNAANVSDRPQSDLLGGQPAADVTVPWHPQDDAGFFVRQFEAMLAEVPLTAKRAATIRLRNRKQLERLEREAPADHTRIWGKLGEAR